MEFKYKLDTSYSGLIDIALNYDGEYSNGGSSFTLYCNMDGYPAPYTGLTVWLPGLQPDEIAIDTNNFQGGLKWAIENGIVSPPYRHINSGYCTYPVCKLLKTSN